MTGYGSKSFKIDDFELTIELRTLNSRYFDSKISLPGYVKNYYLSNSICRASKTMGSLARARSSLNLKKAS